MQSHSFINCLGGWSQTIPQVKKPDVEVLGWFGYTSSAVLRPFGHTAKFFKAMLETAYDRETNIQLSGYGGHSCSHPANCKLETSVPLHLCDKTAHFRVAFYCPQHKVELCNDHTV